MPRGRPLFPLELHLAAELAAVGITYGPSPIAIGAFWGAFRSFAVAPVDELVPGLKMPREGADMDTLAFEPVPARETVPNVPARPPGLLIARRVYLVNRDGEFEQQATASLLFNLADDLAPTVRSQHAMYGPGGPNGGSEQLKWFDSVEQTTFGECLRNPELVVEVTSG